jgi:hypothetical protein
MNHFIDGKYKKLISDLMMKHKKVYHSYNFVNYEDNTGLVYEYYQLIQAFADHYEKELSNVDFLNCLTNTFSRTKILSPIEMLLKIASYSKQDHNRLVIMKYVLENFSVGQLQDHNLNMQFTNPKMYIQYFQLFSLSKFECLRNNIGAEGDFLLAEYINTFVKLNQYLEEN